MTPAPFAGLKHAPTAVYLPACKYGCIRWGECKPNASEMVEE